MKIIVCIDKSNGMLFNGRRQSQDRVLREKILSLLAGKKLYVNEYTAGQFENTDNLYVGEDFLQQAGCEDFCFIENAPVPAGAEEIYLFRWNRDYPADTYFSLELKPGYRKVKTEDFPGYSHKKITLDIYKKKG